jgi:hypothetical protein
MRLLLRDLRALLAVELFGLAARCDSTAVRECVEHRQREARRQ